MLQHNLHKWKKQYGFKRFLQKQKKNDGSRQYANTLLLVKSAAYVVVGGLLELNPQKRNCKTASLPDELEPWLMRRMEQKYRIIRE